MTRTLPRPGPRALAPALSLALALVVAASLVLLLAGPRVWAAQAVHEPEPDTAIPAAYRRAADRSLLGLPEWTLAQSRVDHAEFLSQRGEPSRFPAFAQIGWFWQTCMAAVDQGAPEQATRRRQLKLVADGIGLSLAGAASGLYEQTAGRLAEASKLSARVPEELFAARYAASYADFTRTQAWYRFDHAAWLAQLWSSTPTQGPDLLRRWERRYLLSSELLFKAGVAGLIRLAEPGGAAPSAVPAPVIAVVLDRPPTADPVHFSAYATLDSSRADGDVVATLPAAPDALTDYSLWLAAQGLDFRSMAGHRGNVVLSEQVCAEAARGALRPMLEQPLPQRPGCRRVVFALPVARLAQEMRRAQATPESVSVERIVDF